MTAVPGKDGKGAEVDLDDKSSHSTTLSEYMAKNKLIFKKKKKPNKQSIESAKKVIWKLTPEFVFMISSFTSTLLTMFYLMMAFSLLSWQSSIASVLSDSSDPLFQVTEADQLREISEALIENKYFFKREGFLTGRGVAISLIVTSIISFMNTIFGWRAAIFALRFQLTFHRWFDLPMLIAGIMSVIWIYSINDCLAENDIFERSLLDNFQNYGRFGRSDAVINGIQESLGCCGVYGPLDYIDSELRLSGVYATTTREEGSPFIFPSSCCKEWWIRNVHCASTAHNLLEKPSTIRNLILFTETIHQMGCVERTFDVCDRFIWIFKIGMPICIGFYLLHIIIKYLTVIQMLREESAIRGKANQDVRQNGNLGLPLWSDGDALQSSDEEDVETMDTKKATAILKAIPSRKSKKAFKMTQDDIQHFKDRADFAEIENKLKKSYLGKLVEDARDTSQYRTEREKETDAENPEVTQTQSGQGPGQKGTQGQGQPESTDKKKITKKKKKHQLPPPQDTKQEPSEPIVSEPIVAAPIPPQWMKKPGKKITIISREEKPPELPARREKYVAPPPKPKKEKETREKREMPEDQPTLLPTPVPIKRKGTKEEKEILEDEPSQEWGPLPQKRKKKKEPKLEKELLWVGRTQPPPPEVATVVVPPPPPPKPKKKKKKEKPVITIDDYFVPPTPPEPPAKAKSKKKKEKVVTIEDFEPSAPPQPQSQPLKLKKLKIGAPIVGKPVSPEPEPELEDEEILDEHHPNYKSPYTHYTYQWRIKHEKLRRQKEARRIAEERRAAEERGEIYVEQLESHHNYDPLEGHMPHAGPIGPILSLLPPKIPVHLLKSMQHVPPETQISPVESEHKGVNKPKKSIRAITKRRKVKTKAVKETPNWVSTLPEHTKTRKARRKPQAKVDKEKLVAHDD